MGKTGRITQKDIEMARKIVRIFGGVNFSCMSRGYLEEIIRTRYGGYVRGIPVSVMSDGQVHRFAKSVYERSIRLSQLSQVGEGCLEERALTS